MSKDREIMTSRDVSGWGGGWGKLLKDKFNLSSVCIKKKEKKSGWVEWNQVIEDDLESEQNPSL